MIWTDKNGVKKDIEEMNIGHLRNVLSTLCRNDGNKYITGRGVGKNGVPYVKIKRIDNTKKINAVRKELKLRKVEYNFQNRFWKISPERLSRYISSKESREAVASAMEVYDCLNEKQRSAIKSMLIENKKNK